MALVGTVGKPDLRDRLIIDMLPRAPRRRVEHQRIQNLEATLRRQRNGRFHRLRTKHMRKN